jgi:hypothetical protein
MSSSTSSRRWVRALPWVVGVVTIPPFAALVSLTIVFGEPLDVASSVLALPTTLGLLWLGYDCARRAAAGTPVLPIRLAAVIGAIVAVTAVGATAVVIANGARDMPIVGWMLLWMTLLALPGVALVGAGLGAGIVWLQQRPLN